MTRSKTAELSLSVTITGRDRLFGILRINLRADCDKAVIRRRASQRAGKRRVFAASFARRFCVDRERMNAAVEFGAQETIDRSMPIDAALALEGFRYHFYSEMGFS